MNHKLRFGAVAILVFLLSAFILAAQGPAGPRGGGGGGDCPCEFAGPNGPQGPGFGMRRGGGPGFGPRGGFGGQLPPRRVLESVLELTDEQFDELEVLRDELMAAIEPLRDQHKELGESLKAELELENPDPTTLGELMIASRDLREQIRAGHDAFVTSFEGILTPDQLEKLEAWRENPRPRRPRRGK